MAQPYNLTLGKETLELQFTLATGDWFEQKSGHAFITGITSQLGPKTITWMLLAGVRKTRPRMSYEEMQEILQAYLDQGGSLPEITKHMYKALRASGLLKPEDEGEGESVRPIPALGA